MRKVLMVLSLVALAACESPLQSCLSSATQDLNAVNALIAQTQVDLQRGYGTVERQEVRTFNRMCPDFNSDGTVDFEWCEQVVVRNIEEPVAIDLQETQRLLNQLEGQRTRLVPQTNAAIAQCQATFPE